MLGDLLQGTRNVNFFYNLAGDGSTGYTGAASIARNTKLSDNNSPLPRTRAHFRYHMFDDATSLTELRPTGVVSNVYEDFGNPVGFPRVNPGDATAPVTLPSPPFPQTFVRESTKKYNTHLFEVGIEKRIGDLHSIELRLPFVSSLDSNLDLQSTRPVNPGAGGDFGLATPEGTTGNYDAELRDLSIITKTLLFYSDSFALSGGIGIRLPTSPTSTIQVFDAVNAVDTYTSAGLGFYSGAYQIVTDFRTRNIKTDFRSVSLTPYLALAYAKRGSPYFSNTFLSVETPLGEDKVTYREQFESAFDATDIDASITQGALFEGTSGSVNIRDQTLLSVDLSAGRWINLRRRPRWLSGLAFIGELHYTSTRNDAETASFQSVINRNGNPVTIDVPTSIVIPEPATEVGNRANRLDILNTTLGTFMRIGGKTTFSTGVGLPLRSGNDKVFDYELQFQLNYYPRGFSGLPPVF